MNDIIIAGLDDMNGGICMDSIAHATNQHGIIRNGLVGYWDFTRGNSHDLSPSGYHGTDYNIIYQGSDGAYYNGVNSEIVMGDVLGFNNTHAFTLFCLFRTTQYTKTILAKQSSSPFTGYNFFLQNTGIMLVCGNGADIKIFENRPVLPYVDGQWHGVFAVFNPPNGQIWLWDEQKTLVVTGSIIGDMTTTYPFKAGSRGFGNFFEGNQRIALVYNRALADQEIGAMSRYLKVRFGL